MILHFPRPYRSRIEVFSVRERDSGRRLHILEYVGHDKDGPFRIDVGQYHDISDLLAAGRVWMRSGVDVVNAGLFQ